MTGAPSREKLRGAPAYPLVQRHRATDTMSGGGRHLHEEDCDAVARIDREAGTGVLAAACGGSDNDGPAGAHTN